VRTLVLASATLAILFVVFALYQALQLDPDVARDLSERTEVTPVDISGDRHGPTIKAPVPTPIGTTQVDVGRGRNIQLRIFPREGTEAAIELAVSRYQPVPGTTDQFEVSDPMFRLRTPEGMAVRVTADEGILEAQMSPGGALRAQFGRLIGDVEIVIDRRTDEYKAQLPKAQRDKPGPDDIITVSMDRVEFDLEYARIVIPGDFELQATDVELRAADLEVRFNEVENRVEYLRIGTGKQLVVQERATEFGINVPGGTEQVQRVTLADRLRATIRRQIEALQEQADPTEAEPPPARRRVVTADGEVVDLATPEEGQSAITTAGSVKYFAHFEGDIDARQMNGADVQARLQADILEIVRDFTVEDRVQIEERNQQASQRGPSELAPKSREQIVLDWSGRLSVEVLAADDVRAAGVGKARLTAVGTPVRVSDADGDAVCQTLVFDADTGAVRFQAPPAEPVVIRSADQGRLECAEARFSRDDKAFLVDVRGPGQLDAVPDDGQGHTVDAVIGTTPGGSSVRFEEKLEARGRVESRREVDFTGAVTTREVRLLDYADFLGTVRLRYEDTQMDGEHVRLTFAEEAGEQHIQRIDADGGVKFLREDLSLSCQSAYTLLAVDRDGGMYPLRLCAERNISAAQGDLSIGAEDELIVDFDAVYSPAEQVDILPLYQKALAEGLDPEEVDWAARRQAAQGDVERTVVVRRVQAAGRVAVVEPEQELDLMAERVDCSLTDAREVARAVVVGEEGRTASVRLGSFTVAGETVRLDVPDRWAEVPGAGRMTFRSQKDLDGREVDEPIPVSVSWQGWMKYQGRENRAVFSDGVQAISQATTKIDCDWMEVEFDDVAADADDGSKVDWWIFEGLADRVLEDRRPKGDLPVATDVFAKEPASILARGNVVALTSELDDEDQLVTRARMAGQRLSVNLRAEVSKLLIEGAGTLLLEDFRPARASGAVDDKQGMSVASGSDGASSGGGPIGSDSSLFSLATASGPSKTLIAWQRTMWYDFSICRTLFEGDVEVTYLSGAALKALGDDRLVQLAGDEPGRQTHVNCRALSVEFECADEVARREGTRFGRLSVERFRAFRAEGGVTVRDDVIGFSAQTRSLTYEKDRNLLELRGTEREPADLLLEPPGKLLQHVSDPRILYNPSTGEIHTEKLDAWGG
jgi:hypothetical protein